MQRLDSDQRQIDSKVADEAKDAALQKSSGSRTVATVVGIKTSYIIGYLTQCLPTSAIRVPGQLILAAK